MAAAAAGRGRGGDRILQLRRRGADRSAESAYTDPIICPANDHVANLRSRFSVIGRRAGEVLLEQPAVGRSHAYLAVVEADGFTCAEALGGTRCDKTTPNSQFPVDTIENVFTRDDVWIYISMTNIDSGPLLPDIVATAWAA